MTDKIQKAKEELAQQKKTDEHDQVTLKTDKVAFGHAFKMFWRQGRNLSKLTSRHNYWYMLIWQWIIKGVAFVLATLFGGMGVISSLDVQTGGRTGMLLIGLMAVLYILVGGYTLVTFVPMLTLTMRRYKDVGINRFLGMLIYIIMGILAIVYIFVGATGRTVTMSIFVVLALGNLLLCSLPRGQFIHKDKE